MGVIPALDELEDGHAYLRVRGEGHPFYEFTLKRGKEALTHGIVVARTAHRWPDAGLLAPPAKGK